MYDYHANVERVTDGDTVRMTLDHGMHIRSSQAIRLADVFAPELGATGGVEARAFVSDWCTFHGRGVWPFLVVTHKDRQTFNRYVGIISCRDCRMVLNDDVNSYLAVT